MRGRAWMVVAALTLILVGAVLAHHPTPPPPAGRTCAHATGLILVSPGYTDGESGSYPEGDPHSCQKAARKTVVPLLVISLGGGAAAYALARRARRKREAPDEKLPPRRVPARWAIGAAVVLLGAGIAYVVHDATTDSYTGPAPTVSEDDSCGGGSPSALFAIDADSGRQRWTARTGGAWQLAMADETVGALGNGELRALDIATGRARWCHDFEPEGQILGAVGVGDVIAGGEGNGTNLVGWRVSDGEEVWSRRVDGDLLTSDGELAVVRRGFASDDGEETLGIEGATGRVRWQYRTPPPGLGTPNLPPLHAMRDLGLTFVHDGLGVAAVGRATEGPTGASVRWTETVLRPAGVHGHLLIGGSLAPNTGGDLTRFVLQARDGATGVVRWKKTVPGFDGRVVGDVVVVLESADPKEAPGVALEPLQPHARSADSKSVATAYDVLTGAQRWRTTIRFGAAIVAAGDVAVVWMPVRSNADDHSELVALDGRTGEVAWRRALDNPSRTEHFHLPDELWDLRYDSSSGSVLVLMQAGEPYRD